MKSILNDLYYGRISPWERKPDDNDRHRSLNRKIDSEKRYFVEKMSVDDCQRFQDLQNLWHEADGYEHLSAFSNGFKLGVAFMCAVFVDDSKPFYGEE